MPSAKNEAVDQAKDVAHPVRLMIVQGLSSVEDVVYVGLGILLAIAAITLVVASFKSLVSALIAHSLTGQIVNLLDQILLVLLIVELLYTVQVSFREHGLVAEPFLVVALIAAIRRVLIITAEVSKMREGGEAVFKQTIVELSVLTFMILIFVGSLTVLQKTRPSRRESAS
jgi:uncharacterized membrane protein (DUF373 family)